MLRRLLVLTAILSLVVSVASGTPAQSDSSGNTTVARTIKDLNDDNLLEFGRGERHIVLNGPKRFRPPDRTIVHFLQLTDFQLVDEESPARVEFLDPSQRPSGPFSAAYRPQESMTPQVEEAMVRAARKAVSAITGNRLRFTILTGDNADSQAYNETRWFIDILDGTITPRTSTSVTTTAQGLFGAPGDQVTFQVGPPPRINPNSGIPTTMCPATQGTIYDGVRGGGQDGSPDDGFYEPDSSAANTDGDGYSPDRQENQTETGSGETADVTVRDFPGILEQANLPFEAVGLGMPWYSAFGNHDALIQGNSPDAYVGPGSQNGTPHAPDTETWNPQFQLIATGCLKPKTATQRSALVNALANGQIEPGEIASLAGIPVVPSDPRRCFLAKDEMVVGAPVPCDQNGWIQQHFLTAGKPVGHGFRPTPTCALPSLNNSDPLGDQIENLPASAFCTEYGRPPLADLFNDGYYSFRPKKGLRFIVLDTITDDCGAEVCSEGSVDNAQFRWLEAQIVDAASKKEYVMVFSHHTLRTIRFPTTDESEQPAHYGQLVDPRDNFNPQNPSGEKTLAQLFCENPNVLAHIAGHEHANYVDHYTCDGTPQSGLASGPSSALGGFWHISTAAHIDWPQQSRMIELIDNGNRKSMSLVLTMLDQAGPPRPPKFGSINNVLRLASIAREISYNDYQHSRDARGRRRDRNVIIVLKRPWLYPTAAPRGGDPEDD